MLGELARGYKLRDRPASAGEAAVRDARMTLEGRAHLTRVQHDAPLRVCEFEGSFYIDLGTSAWSAIEVSANGWRIVANAPAPIVRSKRTAPFPVPSPGDGFAKLRTLLGHLPDEDFVLFVSWCVGALMPQGPFPILILSGEQGSGKSTWLALPSV